MYHFNPIKSSVDDAAYESSINKNDRVLKVSPHGSFKVTQLCKSVAICEAMKGDKNKWGNSTDTEPAFVTYVGCQRDQVKSYIKDFNNLYRCHICKVRNPKYLKDFEVEIKVYAMQRYSNGEAFGLDYLIDSESAEHSEIDSDEYNYYTTGYMPRW